jgi:hypothetical protein
MKDKTKHYLCIPGISTLTEALGIQSVVPRIGTAVVMLGDAASRACVFLKWLKMVLIPFCTLPQVLEGPLLPRNQQEMRSPKLTQKRKRRIKTIFGQFRNRHAPYNHAGLLARESL